jgi:hypothetical protein
MSISSQVQVSTESQAETPLARQVTRAVFSQHPGSDALGGTPSRMPRELCQGSLLKLVS